MVRVVVGYSHIMVSDDPGGPMTGTFRYGIYLGSTQWSIPKSPSSRETLAFIIDAETRKPGWVSNRYLVVVR